MARIPGPQDVRQVGSPRDPGLNVSPTAFGSQGGESLVSAGRDVQRTGLRLDRSEKEQQQKAAIAREKAQRLQDATFVNEQLLDLDRDLTVELDRRLREDDATAPNFVDGFDEFANSVVTQRLQPPDGRQISPNALTQLRLKAQGMRLGFVERAITGAGKARAQKATDVLDARSNAIANKVRRDPGLLDAALAEVDSTVDDFGDSLTADGRRDLKELGRLKAIESAVSGLSEQGAFGAAEALLDDKRFDEILPPEAKDRLRGVLKRGRAFDRAEVKDLVNDHIASIQNTGQGIPGLEERARRSLDAREFKNFRQSEDLALDFFGASQRIRFAEPQDIVATLNEFQPKSGDESFADRARLLSSLQTEAKRIMQARAADPMGFVQQAPEMRGLVEAAEDPTMAQRMVRAGQAYQARLGIPRSRQRTLSVSQAQGIIADIQSRPMSERAGALLGLQEQYGAFFPDVMRDLADKGFNNVGLDPRVMVLASIAGNPALSQQMAAVLEVGRKELKAGLEGEVVSDTTRRVRTEIAPWMQAARNGAFGVEREPMLNGIAAAVEDLALSYVRDGEASATAAKRAADQVINDRFTVQGTYYVPKVDPQGRLYSTASIDGFLRERLTREKLEAFGIESFGDRATVADDRGPFNPEGRGFDMETAQAFGMLPASSGPNKGHFGSVVPTTPEQHGKLGLPENSFMILKGRRHPTFHKAVAAEEARGFKVIKRGDRFFSVPASESGEAVSAEPPRAFDINDERTLRAAVESGFWVTNEDGTGVYLMVPFRSGGALPLLDADGRRYEFSFRQASDAGASPLTIPDAPSGFEGPGG